MPIHQGWISYAAGRQGGLFAVGAEDCGDDNKHEDTLSGKKKLIQDQYVYMQTILQFFVNIPIKWLIKLSLVCMDKFNLFSRPPLQNC